MKLSKLIRRTHMYLALFLTPWLLIYAMSGFVLNHGKWFGMGGGVKPPPFEKIEEREYHAEFSKDADERFIAAQMLAELKLSGPFHVDGDSDGPKLEIRRHAAFAEYRITYLREPNRLIVERQQVNKTMFLNRSHFRHGYYQSDAASIAWGVIVDLVVVSLIVWVLSGLWMWWEIKPSRAWGAMFGLVGVGLFAVLLFTI